MVKGVHLFFLFFFLRVLDLKIIHHPRALLTVDVLFIHQKISSLII